MSIIKDEFGREKFVIRDSWIGKTKDEYELEDYLSHLNRRIDRLVDSIKELKTDREAT